MRRTNNLLVAYRAIGCEAHSVLDKRQSLQSSDNVSNDPASLSLVLIALKTHHPPLTNNNCIIVLCE